jgi:hypothetical protein
MLQVYASNILVVFRDMLQVYHVNVAKVDHDVACVASVLEAYYNRLFKIFYRFSDVCLQAFLFGCCMCFTHVVRVCSNSFSCFSLMSQ